ncbi:hypothetical protein F4604DRAFT_1742149, partial [Suillus subluteus]
MTPDSVQHLRFSRAVSNGLNISSFRSACFLALFLTPCISSPLLAFCNKCGLVNIHTHAHTYHSTLRADWPWDVGAWAAAYYTQSYHCTR